MTFRRSTFTRDGHRITRDGHRITRDGHRITLDGHFYPLKSWSNAENLVSAWSLPYTNTYMVQPSPKYRPNALRAGARFDREAAHRPILVFEDVFKAYRAGEPVLRGVNLTIERGEFVFITGPSGSGKSTLLRLLYRAETVDEGRIFFLGRDVARLTERSIPMLRRNLGIVFQDFKLVLSWSAFDNIAVALEILGLSPRLIRTRVGEALERVGLGGRGEDRAALLSGGEQQRIAIARAIVSEPALLLADEPTGNLDPQLAADILGLFEELHAAGTTVLFATHDRSLLEIHPRRVVVLDEGKAIDVPQGLGAASNPLQAQASMLLSSAAPMPLKAHPVRASANAFASRSHALQEDEITDVVICGGQAVARPW